MDSSDLRAAMAQAGVDPGDEVLVADGQLRRYRGPGDKPGRLNCWYVFFREGGAAFGSWRLDVHGSVSSNGNGKLSAADRKRIKGAQAQAEAEREKRHEAAAAKAEKLRDRALPLNSHDDHAYLRAKGIQPHRTRRLGSALVVPMTVVDTGKLASLQFIHDSLQTG
jgi:putative DNA primase/helicase